MKNVIVILAILMTSMSYGQKHIATITGHLGGNNDNVGLYYRITMGGKTIATNSISGGISIEVDVQNKEIEASADEIYIFLSWQGTFDGTGKPGSAEGTLKISSCYQASNLTIPLKDLGNGIGGYARLDINIRPEIKILPPDDNEYFLPLDQKVIIKAPEGFSSDVYNWEYKLEDSNWATIKTTHNGRYILGEDENGASALDLFPSAQNFLGENVRFRIKYCGDRYTPEVIYRVVPSAPTFTTKVETKAVCYDGKGQVEFIFSRPLYLNEKISILKKDPDAGEEEYTDNLTTSSQTENIVVFQGANKNSYTLEDVPVGKYKIGVLGFYGDYNTYAGSKAHDILFSIDRPDPVVFGEEIAVTHIKCFDDTSNGSVTLLLSGGSGSYQFHYRNKDGGAWSSWLDYSNGVEDLDAGTYEIQIRDSNGCLAREQILVGGKIELGEVITREATITRPEPISVNVELLESPTANGFKNAKIMATINGGTPIDGKHYTYTWIDNSNNTELTTSSGSYNAGQGYLVKLHSIGVGKYTITVRDAHTCAPVTATFDITYQPDPLTIVFEVEEAISCSGASDGILKATVTGGVPFNTVSPDTTIYPEDAEGNLLPYFYYWKEKLDDNTWKSFPSNTGNTLRSLKSGTYSLNVKDKNGIFIAEYEAILTPVTTNYIIKNFRDQEVELLEPKPLELAIVTKPIRCFEGTDGSARVEKVTGGTGGYIYTWKNSDGIPISSQAAATGLSAGNYTITVTDANGCTIEDVVDIIQPKALSVTFDTTRATCGGSDGSATVQVNGGTEGYTYVWNTGETTQKIEGLKADTYTVTITDANDCKITDTIVIQEPDPITIERIETTRTNCGGAIGTAEVVMSGDTAPYTYHWSTGAITPKIENLPYGEYTVTVKDKNNCIVEGSTIIQEPDPIAVERFETTSGTCDEPNGAAKVIMSGATGPYTYEWSTGATTQEITNVRAGKYFVLVTDTNYCTTTGKVIIEEISGIEIDVISHVDPLCATSKDGSITVLPKGGTEPYTYMWTKKGTFEVIATSADISGLLSGTYVVEVNDAIGCTKVYEETLIAPEVVEVVLGNDLSICRGQSVAFDITIDDPNATYSWVSDTGYSNNTSTVELIDSGTYTATVTTGIGCVGTDEVVITVSDNPIDADFLYSTYSFSDQQVEVINTSNPIGERIEWTVSEGANIVEETKEKIILSFEKSDIPKTYYTTLTSYNKNEECSISLTKPIIIEPGEGFSEDLGNEKFIEEFLIFPNANNGNFSIKVNLAEPSDVRVKIMSLMSTMIDKQEGKGADSYELRHNLSIAPGIYLVVLETSHGAETRKLVVE
ncbi:T9SS type A sorting domain-containing protein [Aquimarina spinulae]|uniref:T9SS type A sorting domain-containing protein n=1 Tax=Aquimarina spinulae TaxID=1192023 RepID=UPI000D55B0AC|nr:T9SS type A sorting domain-containing protein [Aquimarina spinulae]